MLRQGRYVAISFQAYAVYSEAMSVNPNDHQLIQGSHVCILHVDLIITL